MWQAMGLEDIARHVIGCHSSQETRVERLRVDDMACNIGRPYRAARADWLPRRPLVKSCLAVPTPTLPCSARSPASRPTFSSW